MDAPMITDGVLIQRYIAGNQAAFETLLKRHKMRIFTSIYVLVNDRYLAEDIFQEVFIKVVQSVNAGKYNHEDKFLPWAMRIARNLSIDHIRSRKRMPMVTDSEGGDIFDNIGLFEKSPEQLRIEKDKNAHLRSLIWKLPEEQREVLVLRHYADLSFKEIAALTNSNLNTCIGRMHYAVLNLRKMMQKNAVAVK